MYVIAGDKSLAHARLFHAGGSPVRIILQQIPPL